MKSCAEELIFAISDHLDSLKSAKWICKHILKNSYKDLSILINEKYSESKSKYASTIEEQAEMVHLLKKVIDFKFIDPCKQNEDLQSNIVEVFNERIYSKLNVSKINQTQFVIRKPAQLLSVGMLSEP